MESGLPKIVKLTCSVKNYGWGKMGKNSAVAALYAKNSGEAAVEDARYAEFWMGTHDSGPSYVVLSPEVSGGLLDKLSTSSSVSLKNWIGKNPGVLGDEVLEKWGPNLPFLFKVLSVAKALSIQAHPDKGLAEILHKQQPCVYKDDNHKPEMTLALTEFEALCGFVSLQELKTVIESVTEIVEVVGTSCADQMLNTTEEGEEDTVKDALRSLFTRLMSASKPVISDATSKLITRLNLKEQAGTLTERERLVLKLEEQYPGDIGLMASFLFNYVRLKPGEALYLGANEPHAYLRGECVECMATSDNVVRAGLTPKFRDVEILCSMLTYNQGPPKILTGSPSYPYTVKYLPPFDEFEIELCRLPHGASTVFPAVPGPSIFVVLSGEGAVSSAGLPIAEGDVVFASANTEIATQTVEGLNMCRAGVNSMFFKK